MHVKSRIVQAEWQRPGPEVQRLLQGGWVVFKRGQVWEPPTDVYENDEGLVVQVEIAGVREQDIAISLDECTLVVRGTRLDREPKQTYRQMEIHYGEFRTEIHLPWAVEPDRVEATYEAGFLRILFPRQRAHRVQVTCKTRAGE